MPVEPQIVYARKSPEGVAVLWRLGGDLRLVCAPTWAKAWASIVEATGDLDPEIELDAWLLAAIAAGKSAAAELKAAAARRA